jgi:hypothetical protein
MGRFSRWVSVISYADRNPLIRLAEANCTKVLNYETRQGARDGRRVRRGRLSMTKRGNETVALTKSAHKVEVKVLRNAVWFTAW